MAEQSHNRMWDKIEVPSERCDTSETASPHLSSLTLWVMVCCDSMLPGSPRVRSGDIGHPDLTARYGFIYFKLSAVATAAVQGSCSDWRSQTSVMSFVCKHVTGDTSHWPINISQSEGRVSDQWEGRGWDNLWQFVTRICGANEDNLINAD